MKPILILVGLQLAIWLVFILCERAKSAINHIIRSIKK